jgi:hypothetical protein
MIDNELTLREFAKLVNDEMYYHDKKNLLNAYSCVHGKYQVDYSYEEVKDYLFHHDLSKEEET